MYRPSFNDQKNATSPTKPRPIEIEIGIGIRNR